ncbi:MAG: protein translocase subunit SecF [Gammaproteobacteria bacterium]|nr:protein translocase subunit SecF [Gammaproteobacteria bacterium]MCI0591064.1 protein translocase subunit SecF [Gammaproteobacteria bacterium]
MEFFRSATHFDFMGKRKIAYALSGILLAISVFSLATRGLNFGIDFTGGTLIEVGYQGPAELDSVRKILAASDFANAVVQHFGTTQDVLIRIAPQEGMNSAQISNRMLELLKAGGHDVEMRRVEFVGAQVGEELKEDGSLAMLVALIGILIYVTLRFESRLALGAVAALVHDATATVGLFSVTQMNFDLTVLAAILAVIGYSLNDTIVVFDRVRECFRKLRTETPEEVFNVSLNQTLSRTMMTSVATLLVLIALYIFGGEVNHGFAIALIFGIVIGTYSSIYIASPLALVLGVSRRNLMPVKKEGHELDSLP